jgi:apolipoprotein N-acyltransferase
MVVPETHHVSILYIYGFVFFTFWSFWPYNGLHDSALITIYQTNCPSGIYSEADEHMF